MKILRNFLILFGMLLVVGVVNRDILRKEDTLANGRLVLLELRPVDPRSLFQGDYMLLRYAATTFPPAGTIDAMPRRGVLVLQLDDGGIGRFKRIDDGSPLAANEARMRYKSQHWQAELRLGAEAFFFQEGDAEIYANARFGMLRIDPSGNSILIGLADKDRRQLGRPAATD
ncbi:MAG: GDYXXLXY domain-containing protein [Dongiaceae bacterium]